MLKDEDVFLHLTFSRTKISVSLRCLFTSFGLGKIRFLSARSDEKIKEFEKEFRALKFCFKSSSSNSEVPLEAVICH